MSLFFKNRKQTKNSSDNNITIQNENSSTLSVLINNVLNTINNRFDKMENKIEKLSNEINKVNSKVDFLETRIRAVEIAIEDIYNGKIVKKSQKRRK